MENDSLKTESVLLQIEQEAWEQVAKDTMPVAEKYARKYGTSDGEASDAELDVLMKTFKELTDNR